MYIFIALSVICLIVAILCFLKQKNIAALMSLLGVIASVIGVFAAAFGSTVDVPLSTPPITTPPVISEPLPPTSEQPEKPITHECEMVGCDPRVVYPDDSSWLIEIESKYVRSKRGNCIVLRWEPNEDYEYKGYNYLMKVDEGILVSVLARQDGFSLIKVQDGVVGWVPSRLLGDS